MNIANKYQFIYVKYNQNIKHTLTKISVLLNSFDISACQTAIYNDDDKNIQIKIGGPFLITLFNNVLLYSVSEYTNSCKDNHKY